MLLYTKRPFPPFFRSVVRTRSIFPGEKKCVQDTQVLLDQQKSSARRRGGGDGFLHPPSEKGEERRRCIASLALSALARRKRRRKMHREEHPPPLHPKTLYLSPCEATRTKADSAHILTAAFQECKRHCRDIPPGTTFSSPTGEFHSSVAFGEESISPLTTLYAGPSQCHFAESGGACFSRAWAVATSKRVSFPPLLLPFCRRRLIQFLRDLVVGSLYLSLLLFTSHIYYLLLLLPSPHPWLFNS